MLNLSTSDFKLAKSVFLVKFDLLTPAAFFKVFSCCTIIQI